MQTKNKNYFNEEKFQKLLKVYQSETTLGEDGKTIIKTNKEIQSQLVKEVEKIINAIIMVYRYWIFEDYDDLKQHALQACFTNFMKFSPEKGTAFNYYSIIAKISLLNYTDRKKKHRNHHNIDDFISLEHKEEVNYSLFFDNLEDTLFAIIDENYVGKKREEFVKIASVLIDYLRKTKKWISKSDVYSWSRSLGLKNSEIRQFIKEMSKYKKELFESVL